MSHIYIWLVFCIVCLKLQSSLAMPLLNYLFQQNSFRLLHTKVIL